MELHQACRIESDQYDATIEKFKRHWAKLCEEVAKERPTTLDEPPHTAVA